MLNMNKVLIIGTGIAIVAYIMAGLFGYVTFSTHPDVDQIMNDQNILKAPYGGLTIIKCCLIGLLIVVLFASPFCVLPCKDSVEELLMPDNKKFSKVQNIQWTFIFTIISYAVAFIVPSLGDIMTILGATTNTGIGFLFPIIFYLKIEENNGGTFAPNKLIAYFVFVTISICSCIELYSFIKKKIDPDDANE